MSFHPPKKTAQLARDHGEKKAHLPLSTMLALGFLAGAFIAFGFLLDIRITGNLPEDIWGSMAAFIGGAVFPVGLVFVLIAGGELLTGNMMAVATARFSGKIKTSHVLNNWLIITISNFIGSIFVAYFFGHILGLTETGPFLDKTVDIAGAKIEDNFFEAFISGVGANWLVCLAVWLNYAAEDVAGKILGIWFPIMAFVAIGFQHVVANMFVIPAAIFAGYYTWFDYLMNFIAVFLGNAVGGAIFVGAFYWFAYLRNDV
ncbi:formate/nitrite transporter family protein [Virgibacillus sp. MSP4-1]|uniref:formate/nitrite transporter family protein n=1 Tax=Virgibacillus sp. MSP4-1 TaxID=2700081 RepID=UPI00039FF789|nr:formate/nitrite transporter family protein [Virgibacillus sp. MSP4-1]QHS22380.1 formate/nitrite transporter family protein [Virgibacillus sp. MSP4-1]